ncbi:glycosyl transferase family 2 [Enterococcus florum]|uniref:Glycosyl transferase family 2 n=1 Tax=Enterococcus florum TaxID=2480627 RepID=A0A4P5PE93_9ENTE|nr:glycosyltransferase [Enterococcus florum]GCF93932.1 glycosyl transferase family 2 [Enterococcus florum]
MFDIVIVLYGMTYKESPTIRSLSELLAKASIPEISRILVFDNSETAVPLTQLDHRFVYYHSDENVGLAKAYNFAWRSMSAQWLITLDQDTVLTIEYFRELSQEIKNIPENCAAAAPVVCDREKQISPVFSNTVRPLHGNLPQADTCYRENIMVINSGLAVSKRYLDSIEGYNEEFPLDYLDHWFCWRMFEEKQNLQILKVKLFHQLSVLDLSSLNEKRYTSIIKAEKKFYFTYAQHLKGRYRKQLLLRCIKQIITGKFNFARITWQEF